MVKSNRNLIAVAVSTLGASLANATPVTITQTVNLSQLLDGNNTSIHFDVNAALASHGAGAGQILSGNLIVYGVSDPSYQTTDHGASPYLQTSATARAVGYSYSYYVAVPYYYQYSYSCG